MKLRFLLFSCCLISAIATYGQQNAKVILVRDTITCNCDPPKKCATFKNPQHCVYTPLNYPDSLYNESYIYEYVLMNTPTDTTKKYRPVPMIRHSFTIREKMPAKTFVVNIEGTKIEFKRKDSVSFQITLLKTGKIPVFHLDLYTDVYDYALDVENGKMDYLVRSNRRKK